jgi:hypothetical protein
MEVETQVLIGLDLGYLDKELVLAFMNDSSETGQIINGLMRSLKKRLTTEH